MTLSVLVVDDHAAWRERVCLEFQNSSRWRLVGEAADGLEAVRQARALEPDLILLDIGLPCLNGLESARRIIIDNPTAKILFLSEHRSWNVAEAAFATGAQGYLCKTDAGGKLVPVMDAIAGGVRFISAGLSGEIVLKTLSVDTANGAGRHVAGFYADETSLLDDYVGFAESALAAGSVFVLLADRAREGQLRERLQKRGNGIDRHASEGRYLFLDFAGALSSSIADGQLDAVKFGEAVAALLNGAARTESGARRRIALCGEGAPCLWQGGQAHAAICIEQVWNELSRTAALDSLCAYGAEILRRDDRSRDAFQRICSEHSAVHFRRTGAT